MITSCWDSGEGPAVVLLHAFPCDHTLWRHQADALVASGWRVLLPDLPGFAGTSLPDTEPSLDAVADDVLALLDARGIDTCVIGGVSLGGYVTMALLRRQPARFGGVILCDTKATADAPAARDNRERMANRVLEDPASTPSILEESFLPALLGSTSHASRPDVVSQAKSYITNAPAQTIAWYQRAMAARPDSLPTLADIDVPVLIVYGEEDTLSPAPEQDAMASAARQAQVRVIPEAGHLSLIERPDAVNAAVRPFLDELKGLTTA